MPRLPHLSTSSERCGWSPATQSIPGLTNCVATTTTTTTAHIPPGMGYMPGGFLNLLFAIKKQNKIQVFLLKKIYIYNYVNNKPLRSFFTSDCLQPS